MLAGAPFTTQKPSKNGKAICRLAVERFTQRVFGLPSEDFFPQHMAMLDAVRGLLTPTHLQHLARAQLSAMEEAAELVLPCDGKVGKHLQSGAPVQSWT